MAGNEGDTKDDEIDDEKIRRRAKRAMKALEGDEPKHTIEHDLQHIWVAAGGETGEPGTEEYLSKLYP